MFKTAPISALEVEAALLPSRIRLEASLEKYAFRLQKLSDQHLVNQELALLATLQDSLEIKAKLLKATFSLSL